MHEMVARDGVVSFRRALSLEEWQRVAGKGAFVSDVGSGRLVVERLKIDEIHSEKSPQSDHNAP